MNSNVIFESGMSSQDCDYIIKESEKLLDIKESVVGETDSELISTTRKSKAGFIESYNPKHRELWDIISNRLWSYVNAANRTNFAFDVSFLDSVQYTIYEDGGDHYDWHMDTFINTPNAYTRKLSLTLQLSDGSEYEGGNFELNDGTGQGLPYDALRKKGSVLIFPSFLMHRVTPVTSGIRKTIVAWFEGRQFK